MHLDEERLQRLLHGELDRGAERSAREHVAGCEACRTEAELAEREQAEVSSLLRSLDRPAPSLEPGDIAGLARAGGGDDRSAWGRRAAVVFAGLGLAGVAYAAPGSPIPAWLRAISERPERGIAAPPVRRPDSLQAGEPVASGIAVDPGSRLVIAFPAPPPGARARVSVSDASDAVVRVVAGHAAFSSSADHLTVETADSGAAFQIVLPRSAPSVEIRVGGVTVFRKQGARVTAPGGTPANGSYTMELNPSGR